MLLFFHLHIDFNDFIQFVDNNIKLYRFWFCDKKIMCEKD